MAINKLACQTIVIGAGPYGLAAAAHLRAAGIETRVFGRPMEFWATQMPKGMFVRSVRSASHISDPKRKLTFNHYEAENNLSFQAVASRERFVRYGTWFQKKVVPDLDGRNICSIEKSPNGFRLVLDDETSFETERVIVATGIAPFTRRLPQFQSLPAELASHTSEHCDLGVFSGKRVIVVGGGQSALESAALLKEGGAEVEVIVRAPRINWLDQHGVWLKSPYNPLRPLLYPPTDVGPPGFNLIVARPNLFRKLPRRLQTDIAYRSTRPAGSGWLLPRLREVPIHTGRHVTCANAKGGKVGLRLDDGSDHDADHILQATGYEVDIRRYGFLSPDILRGLRITDGYPELSTGFESSWPGLHFIGATAVHSYGPLCRFVSGTDFSARFLTKHLVKKIPSAMAGG